MALMLILDDGHYEDHSPSIKAELVLKGVLTMSCVYGLIRIKFESQQVCKAAQCQTGWLNYSDIELFMLKADECVYTLEPNHFGNSTETAVIYNNWQLKADESE